MDNNYFNYEQLNNLFLNKGFVQFFSNYFSKYANDEVISKMDLVEGEIEESWNIYIRLFLSSIEIAIASISKIEKNMSFSNEEHKINVSGGIKGRLLINEYAQNKSLIKTPREYPCVVKTKGVVTPENVYLSHIVIAIVDKLRQLMNLYIKNIGNKNATEYKTMNDALNFFSSVMNKQPVAGVISKLGIRNVARDFPSLKMTDLQYRFVKNKVRNAYEYRRLFDWYDKYKNTGIDWTSREGLSFLVYDENFRDRLFELWNLYMISETLCKEYGFKLIKENPLKVKMDDYVYELKSSTGESNYRIYYQKGVGLYYNDEFPQHWHYQKKDGGKRKALRGIPDITVTIDHNGEKNIVLIDLKNKYRQAGHNSEEIYKIIGYYSNFSNYLDAEYPDTNSRKGILIFRNDETTFNERLISNSGERIITFSTSLNSDKILDHDQFKKICEELIVSI